MSENGRHSLHDFAKDFRAAVAEAGQDLKLFAGYSSFKQRVFRIVYHSISEVVVFVLIIVSVGLLIFEVSGSVSGGLNSETKKLFDYAELTLTCFFIIEYCVKFWLAPHKFRFILKNWIDLLALIPFLRVFRLGRGLRLLRLFRLFRLIRLGSLLQSRIAAISEGIEQRVIENVIVIGFMVFAIIFGTVGILIFEGGKEGSSYDSLGDALWWCIVTITTVGYGDMYPETTGGRIVAGIIMFIGLSFYALLTGLVTSLLIDRFRREEGKGMDIAGLKDHTILCGWNSHGGNVIKELLNCDIYKHIVVITELERLPVTDSNVHVIQGDFTERGILERSRVSYARAAIVLADRTGNRSAQDTDARSILGVLAIESFNSDVYTTAEVLNPDNEFHFSNAGVDEIIVSGAYTGNLLAHATINAGLGAAYNDLLTMAGNRLYMVDVSLSLVGKNFKALVTDVQSAHNALVIGIYREGETMLNPVDQFVTEKDMLIILSESLPKLA